MTNNNFIHVILGASGSGKTTAINYLADRYSVKVLTKWTTRRRRENDGPEIASITNIPADCDIRYISYGTEYGMMAWDMWSVLREGRSGAVVVNDIRTLKLLKRQFSDFMKTVYIHSNISADDLLQEELKRYGEEFDSEAQIATQKRIEKIKTVHRKYIENVSFFDKVILNIGTKESLYRQLDIPTPSNNRFGPTHAKAKCFIICGNSFSGKDDLATAMTGMQKDRVKNYKKATDRKKISGDGDHLVHYPDGEIPARFDLIYKKQGHKYGISVEEIWQELASGKSPILILNDIETIRRISHIFRSLAVTVYLHANLTNAKAKEVLLATGLTQKKVIQRIEVANALESEFVSAPSLFDHVLLNTTEKEDLYDQAFNLFDAHCG